MTSVVQRPGSPKPAESRRSVQSLKIEQLGIFSAGAGEEKFGSWYASSERPRSFFNEPTYKSFQELPKVEQESKSAYQRNLNIFPASGSAHVPAREFDLSNRSKSLYEATVNSCSFMASTSFAANGRKGVSFHRSARLGANDDPKQSASMHSRLFYACGPDAEPRPADDDDVRSSLASSDDEEDDVPEAELSSQQSD
mmetsp:Transcript_11191/g.34271  ORF Transcript_11191/g.34271 Transcript_11191/m.34271 type:complete len:197 (+) Transcript_11191:259-849(+)